MKKKKKYIKKEKIFQGIYRAGFQRGIEITFREIQQGDAQRFLHLLDRAKRKGEDEVSVAENIGVQQGG